jgi:CRP-like cAMP-binding protein
VTDPAPSHPGMRNSILAALPAKERLRIFPHLEHVPLDFEQVLLQQGERILFAYFPLSGVIAKLVTMADGGSAEVGMVGKEGMVPLYLFLGFSSLPYQAAVQNPGEALRMKADFFEAEVGRFEALHQLLIRYTGGFLAQLSESAVCNRLHLVEQRYCRWLLMTHDRVGADEFILKQEFVGKALGVRRMSITPVAQSLQEAGLIRYMRGRITILNRQGIEARACECYQYTKSFYDDSASWGQE